MRALTHRGILALVIVLCLPRASFAQDEPAVEMTDNEAEARREYQRGEAEYRTGRYANALNHFERAYELVPRPALLFNVATTLDRLGRASDAILSYRAYLDAEDTVRVDYVRGRIQLLEARLETPNERPQEPESLGDLAPLPAEIALEDRALGPIIMMIAGGAVVLASVGTGIGALSIRGDLNERCVDGRCAEADRVDADRMDRLALTTDILLGVGLAVGVGGLVWFLLAPNANAPCQPAPVSMSCTPQGCVSQATFAF